MKIDLCKLLGVEEGEEFILVSKDGWFDDLKYKIKNNILKVATIEYSDYSQSSFNLNEFKFIEEVIKLPKKKQFSQETLNFFKCIDKKYKWIAKDKDGEVCIYINKPKKEDVSWDNFSLYKPLDIIKDSLFDEILWEDEEPVCIDDYVER